MSYKLLYAKKDLWGGGKKTTSFVTFLSLLAISVGVGVSLSALSVMNGFREKLTSSLLKATPHLLIFSPGKNFPTWEKKRKILQSIEGVKTVSPVLAQEVLLEVKGKSEGILLEGKEGIKGLVVGGRLKEKLGLVKGDRVEIFSPEGKNAFFQVEDFFSTGFYWYDLKTVWLNFSLMEKFLGGRERVRGLRISLSQPWKVKRIRERVEEILGKGYLVKTWKEINRSLLSALQLEKRTMFFLLLAFLVLVELGISSCLMIRVESKVKEIGILQALGVPPRGIMNIFLLEGFFLTLGGIFLGILLGILLTFILPLLPFSLPQDIYGFESLPVQRKIGDFLLLGSLTLGAGLLASLYPALKAAKTNPAKSLREE